MGQHLCRYLQPTNLVKCALEAGAAANQAEKDKRAKYQEIAQRYRFEPIAGESTGVHGPSTRKLINTTCSRIRQVTGDPRETQRLKQMQRGNALCIELRGSYRQKILYYSFDSDEILHTHVKSKKKKTWVTVKNFFSISFIENELFTENVKT